MHWTYYTHLSVRRQICTHYNLEMHYPIYHVPHNRKQSLVKQNSRHLDLMNRNNDQMQMSLGVSGCKMYKEVDEQLRD